MRFLVASPVPVNTNAPVCFASAGSVVIFQGSADLGDKDGGVFDWIGRANDKEFIGFFTSKGYTGVFRMARAK